MHRLRRLLSPLLLLALAPAMAQDLSVSGYGTLGFARSDRPFTYQRFIDDGGTWQRDTVLGVQGDLRLTPQWSATLQMKLAPALDSDDAWALKPAWAFVAWRPANDWLVRAGRMRVPLYLHSESLDVGVSYDLARLPAEMYSIVPSSDFNGASVARSWTVGSGELSADAYAGRVGTTARFWFRDGLPPAWPQGAGFEDVTVASRGLVLTWRAPESTWRAGLHRTSTSRNSGKSLAVRYPFVDLQIPNLPGVGYYQVDGAMPGPGIEQTGSVRNTMLTVGFDQTLAPGWRLSGEYARMRQRGSELGSESDGGYLALLRNVDRFTPYVSVSRIRSTDTVLGWQRKLTGTQLPAFLPGADMVNAAMRAAGESGYAIDQRSWALGTSYAIDGRQKLKIEYQRTHVGQVSRLVDTPAGQPTVSDTSIGVWSFNYSFGF